MAYIKSPLRYPGGKSRAVQQILRYAPDIITEFREPFVGGGSVFIFFKQKYPHLKIWINDLNAELIAFWTHTQQNNAALVAEISRIKKTRSDGRSLFYELRNADIDSLSEFERAVRFFVLNRISFSGTVDAGGYSQRAFEKRFTWSSIERVAKLEPLLADVSITRLDYTALLGGENAFIFLDPPYLEATKSRLYGKGGKLHTSFDHIRFAVMMKNCTAHQWLITYDDSPTIRQNFSFAHIYTWELQYGMNNYMQKTAAKGKELFITNYPVSGIKVEQSFNHQLPLIFE